MLESSLTAQNLDTPIQKTAIPQIHKVCAYLCDSHFGLYGARQLFDWSKQLLLCEQFQNDFKTVSTSHYLVRYTVTIILYCYIIHQPMPIFFPIYFNFLWGLSLLALKQHRGVMFNYILSLLLPRHIQKICKLHHCGPIRSHSVVYFIKL